MPRPAARLVVKGRVQGVGYRWWTVSEAEQLSLDGWVRNRSDGSVEILAIGEPAALDRLAAACARGPRGAWVEQIGRTPAEDDGSVGFAPRPTI